MHKKISKIALWTCMACVVASTTMVGCKKKTDYEKLYNDLVVTNNQNVSKIEALNLALASYDEKYKDNVDLSRYTKLDTGKRVYTKFNDKVYLDDGVDFGNVDSISNSSTIGLTDNITVSPSDAWNISLNTSQTNLYNSANDITGDIQIYRVYESTAAEFIYTKFIEPFVTANELEVSDRKTMFVGQNKAGVEIESKVLLQSIEDNSDTRSIKAKEILTADELAERQAEADKAVQESEAARIQEYLETMESTEAQTNEAGETIPVSLPETSAHASDVGEQNIEVKLPSTTTKETNSILRIGVIMQGDKAILYKFIYKDDDTANSSKEIINSLLTSMKINGSLVSIGQ